MNRTEAHDRLVKAVNDRTVGARETVERVLNVVPQDSIVKAAGLWFDCQHYQEGGDALRLHGKIRGGVMMRYVMAVVILVTLLALAAPAVAQQRGASGEGYWVFINSNTTYAEAWAGPFDTPQGCGDTASWLNQNFDEYYSCRYGFYTTQFNRQTYSWYIERTTSRGFVGLFTGPIRNETSCQNLAGFLDRTFTSLFRCVYR